MIHFDVSRASCNSQVLKVAADQRDVGFLVSRRMVRRKPRDNAIRLHYVQDIQSLDRRCNQRRVTVVFFLFAAGDLRIGSLKRNDLLEPKPIRARSSVPAAGWQRHPSLHLDNLIEGARNATA